MTKVMIAIFLLLLSACQSEIEKEPKVQKIPESLKSYCVGRHVIRVPATFLLSPISTGIFQIKDASAQEPAFDIVVLSGGITKPKFDAAVQQRRSELKRLEGENTNLVKLDKFISENAVLFRVQEIDDAYFSETYFLRGTTMVKVRRESYRNSYLEAEEKIAKVSAAIKERDSANNSIESGFCLGSVVINYGLSHESASFAFRNESGLKIGLDIDTYASNESVSLLSRMSSEDSLLKKFQIRHDILRARERIVAGMNAEEWLGVGYLSEDDDQRALKFILETKRKTPGEIRPSIMLSFDSAQNLPDGTPTTTSIENAEALELWDRIVDSIKANGPHGN